MRCERCKASCEIHYAESYETDWYCNAGVPEDEMNENKDGEWGCNLHWKTIQKRVEDNEKAWLKDKEEQVEWFLKKEMENKKAENDTEKRKEWPHKPCINYEDGCEERAGCPCVYYKAEMESEDA